MASFNQDPFQPDIQPELSLHSIGQVPIEETEQRGFDVDYPDLASYMVIGHTGRIRVDYREASRADLEKLKIERETCLNELNRKIALQDEELEKTRLDRDQAIRRIVILEKTVDLEHREKELERGEHVLEQKKNHEEILQLQKRNEELEEEVSKLTEEKKRLEEFVRDLNQDVQDLKQQLNILENNRKSEIKEMTDVLAAQHKEDLKVEVDRAVKESMKELTEHLSDQMAALGMPIDNERLNEQGIQLSGIPINISKLTDFKRSSSKSSLSEISPSTSNHSSKHSSPPLIATPPNNTGQPDQQPAGGSSSVSSSSS